MTVATTHASYTDRFEPTPARERENQKLLNAISRRDEHYIFTGDLNAALHSPLLQQLPATTGLKSCGPDYSQNTWATKPFSYHGFEENELNWRLDYVFASNDIKVIKSEILSTDVSDHLPILTELELEENSTS